MKEKPKIQKITTRNMRPYCPRLALKLESPVVSAPAKAIHISLRSFSLAHLLMTRIISSACGLPAFECSIEKTSRRHSRFSLRSTKGGWGECAEKGRDAE